MTDSDEDLSQRHRWAAARDLRWKSLPQAQRKCALGAHPKRQIKWVFPEKVQYKIHQKKISVIEICKVWTNYGLGMLDVAVAAESHFWR